MMLERQCKLIGIGQRQVYSTQYGTQGRSYNGQAYFIWPVEDSTHAKERRKKVGFELSVEDNAQRLDIPYHVLTGEDIRKMPGYQPPAP